MGTSEIIIIIILSVSMALISRWHGGGFFKTSKSIKNLVWALPFGGVTCWLLFPVYGLSFTLVLLTILATVLCLGGKAAGHGGFFDLGSWGVAREDESLEFIIKPLRGKFPEYWYDALGLALLGFAAVSGAVFIVGWHFPILGVIIAAGGIMKAAAYAIGWAVFPDNKDGLATETGEVLTGLFAGLCLGLLFIGG